MRNLLIDRILTITFTLTILYILVNIIIIVNKEIDNSNQSKQEKPISYPEEIQIAKEGDTLIVSSVSDSIYIGFKRK
jgi:hypothetical protein